jgi:serine/threonine protein kinase
MRDASRPPTPTPKEPVSQTQWRFEPLHVPTEWIESYRPGGFHPIHPSDTLKDSRYTIICKLGYGAFSTVWLAEDSKYERRRGPLLCHPLMRILIIHRHNQSVATKVARADARETAGELRLYGRLVSAASNRNHIVLPLDDFQHTGPNGKHQCLVFEPMGPSVGQALERFPDSLEDVGSFDGPPPPPPATDASNPTDLTLGQKKSLLKQLLLGLDCLHSNRIAHGDLNPGNFLLSIRSPSREDLGNIHKSCEAGGKSALVQRSDGKQDLWAPRYLYFDRPLTDLVDTEDGTSAQISDLGAGKNHSSPYAYPQKHAELTGR